MNVSLYQAASAMNAASRWQEVVAENLAAGSVPGFKKRELSFAAVQAGLPANGMSPANHVIPRAISAVNFQFGELRATGSKTDVAIEGAGFFEVQLPDGSFGYTRDGEFHLNGQGQLATKEGYLVLSEAGPVQFDAANPAPFTISPTGEISQGADGKGRLKVVQFEQQNLLRPVGSGLYLADHPGLIPQAATNVTLRQGFLEGANVSPVAEMANLITAMRLFEANSKVFQMQDERLDKAIRELTATT
jgi:flagellar basal body rod protein FlgG